MLIGEASSAITTSPSAGAPASGTSTPFNTSAGLPNASIWIACIAASPFVMYQLVHNEDPTSSKQFHRLTHRRVNATRIGRILGKHHQAEIDRQYGAGGIVRVERVGELFTVLAKSIRQQLLELAVELHDPLLHLPAVGAALDCGIDREATAHAL